MLDNHKKAGDRVPEDIKLPTRVDGEWQTLLSKDLFAGKKVIVFSLPGAFTPTCSSTHLPRYDELAPVFFEHGVDEIVCMSVNDPFVMEAWSKNQKVDHVRLLPDGNGDFFESHGFVSR